MFSLQPIVSEIKIQGFHSIYYFEFGKNFTHSPEQHDFWEVVYVDSGKVVAITDGIGSTLGQGQMIFHEPGELHAHISDTETPNNMLVISFSANSEAMKFFRKKIFTADKTVRTLLKLFLDEARRALGTIPSAYENKEDLDFSKGDFGSLQLLSCYFTELLITLIRDNTQQENKITATVESRTIAQNSLTELIVNFMKENVYQSLCMEDICRHFILGKSQTSAIFKRNTGKSMMEYYQELKIAEARKLLRRDQYTVSQISDMLGFSCIHSFSRAFKKNVGLSPTAYKKSIL